MNRALGKHRFSFSLFLGLSVLAHALFIIAVTPADSLISTAGPRDPINLSLNQKSELNSQVLQTNKKTTAPKPDNEKNSTETTVASFFQPTVQNNAAKTITPDSELSRQEDTGIRQTKEYKTLIKPEKPEKSAKPETSRHLEAPNSREIQRSLRRAITANFSYPPLARRRQWQGLVKISLRIEADGQLSNIHVIKSSGHSILDRAALYSLKRIIILPHDGDWMNGQHFDTVVPIEYRLVENQSIENLLRDS